MRLMQTESGYRMSSTPCTSIKPEFRSRNHTSHLIQTPNLGQWPAADLLPFDRTPFPQDCAYQRACSHATPSGPTLSSCFLLCSTTRTAWRLRQYAMLSSVECCSISPWVVSTPGDVCSLTSCPTYGATDVVCCSIRTTYPPQSGRLQFPGLVDYQLDHACHHITYAFYRPRPVLLPALGNLPWGFSHATSVERRWLLEEHLAAGFVPLFLDCDQPLRKTQPMASSLLYVPIVFSP